MNDPSSPAGAGGKDEMGMLSARLDRRTTQRRKVHALTCTVRVNGADHDLEIGDISEVGLQGETGVSVHAGQWVEIIFPSGETVPGTVRWGVGPYIGVEFERAIVVSATIA